MSLNGNLKIWNGSKWIQTSSKTTIPDSAIHRWKYDEGSGDTVSDSIGSADGTRNGWTWVTGSWVGDASGDGTGDYTETTTLGNFGSNLGEFAVALTVQTSATGCVMGTGYKPGTSGSSQEFRVQNDGHFGGSSGIGLALRDNSKNDLQFETDSTFTDGSKYRVVINKNADDGSDAEVWVNNSQESITVNRSAFDSSNVGDFQSPVGHFASIRDGSARDFIDATLDDIIIFDSTLTSSEIENDYNRQPWS